MKPLGTHSRCVVRPTGIIGLVVALSIAVALTGCQDSVVGQYRMEGSSMEPTLSDATVVDIIDYGDAKPRRGDLVVFRFPGSPDRDFLKRIIGEPGDTVEIRNGTVYIDGAPLDEPYITNKPAYTYGPARVPPKNYFVLGDNRNDSYDSNLWGFLPEENITGRVDL